MRDKAGLTLSGVFNEEPGLSQEVRSLDKISQCIQLNTAQAVRKDGTLTWPLQNWETLVPKFMH